LGANNQIDTPRVGGALVRTAIDLIQELNRESQAAVHCVLVVGFQSTTLFVCASDDNPLQNLNSMIQQGGEPVGFIRVIGEPGTLILESRPLHEYADDSSIAEYLSSLCDAAGKNLQEYLSR
jgi:hypothetical protein